jgi:peroxiredoxin
MVRRPVLAFAFLSAATLAAAAGPNVLPASAATALSAAGDQKPPEKPKPKAPDKPKPKTPDKPKEAEKPKEEKAKPIGIGNEVDAALVLNDIDGKGHKLADLRGKTVVIQFWSSHTSASYDKRLAELATANGSKGVVFLAIDSDKADVEGAKDPAVALREALKTHGLDGKFPLIHDKDGALAKQFSSSATAPHAFVLDAKGVLRYSGAIDDDPAGTRKEGVKHYLSDAIDAVVAGKPVNPATTVPGEAGKK